MILLAAGLLVAYISPRALSFFPAVIGLGLFVLYRVREGKLPPLPFSVFICAGVAIAFMGLSAMWSPDPGFVLERLGKLAGIGLGGLLLVASLRYQNAVPHFYTAYLISLLVGPGLCLLDLISSGLISQLPSGADAPFNPSSLNRATVILFMAYFPALHLYRSGVFSSRGHESLFIRISVLLFILFLFTESQSAQLAFVVGLLAYFLFPVQKRAAWILLGAVLSLLMLAAPFLAQFMFAELLESLSEISWFQRGYVGNRLEIWDFVARKALESPFWGHGLETTRLITDFEAQNLYHKGDSVLHPHNFALQIWIEFGVIGVVMTIAGLVLLLKGMWSHLKPMQQQLFISMFLGTMTVAATGYGLWQSWWIGSFFLLTAYGMLAGSQADLQST